MSDTSKFKPLTADQINQLTANRCSASDWSTIKVSSGFDPSKIKAVTFKGPINIGANVTIENVGLIEVTENPSFGNGVEVNVVNEAGGREVALFNELSAQFAYLLCLHRHRPAFTECLKQIALDYINTNKQDHCTIADNAVIRCVKEIIDVNIQTAAVINGSSSLINGTILSSEQSPAKVGVDVIAKDFIFAEGSAVDTGAIIEKTFVGQGTVIAKRFTAKHCLFFSNCEMYNGEAVSVFAGPYTVSHHKSTLLIACLMSFYNAGSGTNQSNHMYRLGPVHEGKLCRGAKTGSSSYMLLPSSVGAFSVVLGKHNTGFGLSDLPFSRIIPGDDNQTYVHPAVQFLKSGTLRDSIKWPSRDKRKGSKITDIINFGLLTPYTVNQMIQAVKLIIDLLHLSDDDIAFPGAILKRKHAEDALGIYDLAINIYLYEKLVEIARKALDEGVSLGDIFMADSSVSYDAEWIDLAGQFITRSCLDSIYESVESKQIDTMQKFNDYINELNSKLSLTENAYVITTYQNLKGCEVIANDLPAICDELIGLKAFFAQSIFADAEKEYADQSKIGFGIDITDADADFEQVRGFIEDNGFIGMIQADLEKLEETSAKLKLILEENNH